jgi:hypothetical protein
MNKGIFDFEKEIKELRKNFHILQNILNFNITILFLIPFIANFSIIYFDRDVELIVYAKHLLYFLIGYISFLYISLKTLNYIYPKHLREIYAKLKEEFDVEEDVLNTFSKIFYPEEYKEEFEECFEKYYRKDEKNFKQWIKWQEITVKELYIKLLENKELQKDIIEKIIKKSIVVISQNSKDEKIDEQLKLKKEKEIEEKNKEIKKIKSEIKEEIENYFTKEN